MSLGVLVGRFGAYVRDNHIPPAQEVPEADFPTALNHLRDSVSCHLIPLVLLARADRAFLPEESAVIVSHCLTMARRHGLPLEGGEDVLLQEYIDDFYPSLLQLDPALHHLAQSGTEEVAALLRAAQAVAEADGRASVEESRLLAEFVEELGALSKGR